MLNITLFSVFIYRIYAQRKWLHTCVMSDVWNFSRLPTTSTLLNCLLISSPRMAGSVTGSLIGLNDNRYALL